MTATDKQNVDTALLPLLEVFPAIDISAETLPGFRTAVQEMSALPDPATHADVRIEEITIPGGGAAAATLRCLLHRPARGASRGALLGIHGGGFVMGSPEMDAPRNIELVRATGCTILAIDYRLAPEHPHPAALEDCHAALGWLAAQAQALGVESRRVGILGESAGGGLAAALALLARDRKSVQLTCQALIYPMLLPPEHSADTRAPDPRTGHFVWSRASNQFAWSSFLSGSPAAPGTIAGIATNLRTLPPAFLAVGELDLFVHDNLAYVGRLLAAGCSVEAHLYPGAFHAFDRMVDAPVSRRHAAALTAFIQKHLG